MEPIRKKKKGTRDSPFDDALKIKIAREYLQGELGYIRLARKYNIDCSGTVRYFVSWYKEHFPSTDLSAPQTISSIDTSPDQQTNKLTPSASEKQLAKELEDAKLHIAALQTMIALASKDLGVDITKNGGAKQSKP
jgi:transposase-like protein